MGGCCCCCSSRRAEPNSISTYYYLPRASEEQVPLSSGEVANSGQSSGFIVDPDLETSIPCDLNQGVQLTSSHLGWETNAADGKNSDLELKKSDESNVYVIDECPTCLEEYSEENPKMTTKCEHHFHLACIFEWLERSDNCPVCDKEMEIKYDD